MQDYASLGITDTADRRRIFQLIQALRKDLEPNRLNIMTSSASSITTSGIRPPQTYYNNRSPPASPNVSRLPQPAIDPGRYTRMRRQSVMSTTTPATTPKPSQPGASPRPHPRSRTLSDAGRFDLSALQQRSPIASPKSKRDLRRSVLDQPKPAPLRMPSSDEDGAEDDEEEEEETLSRRYRQSAPMLNAYGVPLSSGSVRSRASVGALKYANDPVTYRESDLNQKIRVCVRKRPLSKRDLDRAEKDIAPTLGTRSIKINEPK